MCLNCLSYLSNGFGISHSQIVSLPVAKYIPFSALLKSSVISAAAFGLYMPLHLKMLAMNFCILFVRLK